MELEEFSQISGKYFPLIASSAKSTQLRHMDYVTEENAIFSIFDERISIDEKENLRIKLLGSSRKEQLKQLLTIDPNVSLLASDLKKENNICPMSTVDENSQDFVKLINKTDQMLYEKDFVEVEEVDEVLKNVVDETKKLKNFSCVTSQNPFDFITLHSLKTLVNFGINISFMLFNAAEWSDHKSFLSAIEAAKNIQSTSIYTEQLVGKISLLNSSCLVKNKDKLNGLALSAVERTGIK